MRGILRDGARIRTAWPPVLGVLAIFAFAGVVEAAGGARLILPDVCVESGDRTAVIPLVLTGADELRPSSLRTTVLFDPQIVAVEGVEDPSHLGMNWTLDQATGRVDLVWHTQGRQPVPPLPAGVLARIKLRLLDPAAREPRLEVDAGQTRSLDGNGRIANVGVTGPATLVQGSGGLWVEMSVDRGRTIIASSGSSLRGRPWILRGRMGDLIRADHKVLLGSLEALEAGRDGRLSVDTEIPARGGVFYYLAVRDDGAGHPVLGFDSQCRPRLVLAARAATP